MGNNPVEGAVAQARKAWAAAADFATREPARPAVEDRRYGLVVDRPTWLLDTERVQRNVYELEPSGVAYIKEQATAAIVELAEMLQSLPWKAGRDGLPGREPTDAEAAHAREELVDVLIFAGNLAVALGFDDETLWREVNGKACRNIERRATAR